MSQTLFTPGEAAKATGKAKSTIQRAINKGRLSAEKNDKGEFQIQAAELFRVFEKVPEQNGASAEPAALKEPESHSERISFELLKARAEAAEKMAERVDAERSRERTQLEDRIDDLKARLDKSEEERVRMTRLLAPPAQTQDQPAAHPLTQLFSWGRRASS